jgi:hypothetical protein
MAACQGLIQLPAVNAIRTGRRGLDRGPVRLASAGKAQAAEIPARVGAEGDLMRPARTPGPACGMSGEGREGERQSGGGWLRFAGLEQ